MMLVMSIIYLGKSGIVAERMAASLSSTGTPAHYVHGAEWTHGDLGKFFVAVQLHCNVPQIQMNRNPFVFVLVYIPQCLASVFHFEMKHCFPFIICFIQIYIFSSFYLVTSNFFVLIGTY